MFLTGYAIVITLFLNGKYIKKVILGDGVIGDAAVENLQDLIFSNVNGVALNDDEIKAGKIYGHDEYETWEAGGFIPAQEPAFDVFSASYVFPGQGA